MIFTLLTSDTLNYWQQERAIFKGKITPIRPVVFWSSLQGSSREPIATYTPDANGYVIIDVTDYLRTYNKIKGASIILYFKIAAITHSHTMINAGLINPQGVLIPPHDLDAFGAVVVPPSKIIISGTHSDLTTCEFYGSQGTWNVTGFATMSSDKRFIGQIDDYFVLSNGTQSHLYTPILMQDCARYALVKWVSFTGVERTAYFEVRGQKSAVSDEYQLQPIDNEYIEIKGRTDGLVLALDGLNAYDVWYYSDVALSSKVEISLDGGQTFDRVQVTTKEVETPDFVMNGKVEITVNWKRYDAVNL